jgi:hypothetical protein
VRSGGSSDECSTGSGTAMPRLCCWPGPRTGWSPGGGVTPTSPTTQDLYGWVRKRCATGRGELTVLWRAGRLEAVPAPCQQGDGVSRLGHLAEGPQKLLRILTVTEMQAIPPGSWSGQRLADSQTGSQQSRDPGDVQPRQAIERPGHGHVAPHPASSGDVMKSPPKP